MEYAIKIYNEKDIQIGELMNASTEDVLKLIGKGFIIKDMHDGHIITESDVSSVVGISESVMGV